MSHLSKLACSKQLDKKKKIKNCFHGKKKKNNRNVIYILMHDHMNSASHFHNLLWVSKFGPLNVLLTFYVTKLGQIFFFIIHKIS